MMRIRSINFSVCFFVLIFSACGIKNKTDSNQIDTTEEKVPPVVEAAIVVECDQLLINRINQNLINLSQEEIYNFVSSLNVDCKNDVEFIESYNEVLFKVLNTHPSMFCEGLLTIEETKLVLIYEELSYPVNDGINVDEAIEAVESITCNEEKKKEILKSLIVAKNRYN